MKKNKLFIAGLVTVFVALVSLTLVSSTWAKYTSTASGSDTARVAKWGFNTTTIELNNLFKNAYDSEVDPSVKAPVDVIAPGTKNSVAVNFSPEGGAPEVSYKLTYTADFTFENSDLKAKLDANDSFYWTLKVGTNAEQNYQTVEAFEAAIEELSATYGPNVAPTSGNIVVGWVWEIDGQDVKDTELGNSVETLKSLTLSISVTATQID